MLDDPIVPAELYTAAYIYIREPVVDVSDFFSQDYSLPFLSSPRSVYDYDASRIL